VRDVVGYKGEIVWNKSRPDGTPRKLLDTSRINALQWKPTIPLPEGVAEVYRFFATKVGAI
jgi:GDP-L-fucose synthase